ncbi:Heat shock protein DnaJ [Tripterygium wilfordii]|uniref:Heat shock protein DnaJ n=1 Tax=Tripterygium wilfordii TaxID=458696 RepID=A0A7J7CSH5_TRIWF|nr:chaperone protein dnaJ 49 [Tripterygium wilfordii]XP_038723726.1 chaperone protein dnaJ 49 [Tripterygium wilfordii]KAF5736994.1 Heat shock protein DnaJ [Tripterygium wilfordii]
MDGNKDEALRCVQIAQEAIASGNKELALRFIKFAQRLNRDVPVEELLAACEGLGPDSKPSEDGIDAKCVDENKNDCGPVKKDGVVNGKRKYTEEHVQLIGKIKRNKDYYAILGVEKTCSVEEIKKAYKKLSLKVHPDKNKAPGAEEAFKNVCKAFKCLSDENSRKQYDQTGLIGGFEYNQQYNVRRRYRRTTHDFFDDNFDPDEIFRAFFGQTDMFRARRTDRTRDMGRQQRQELHGEGPNLIFLLQLLPILLIFLLAYLPFSEPDYSLHRNYSYDIPKTTEKYGVNYFVKSSAFDEKFPLGSPERVTVEDNVINNYQDLLWRYCHVEQQKRRWNKNMPTPHCNKLYNLGWA